MAVIAFLEDKIYDLQAFVGVIAAYPVHIMTVVGSVLLFFSGSTTPKKTI